MRGIALGTLAGLVIIAIVCALNWQAITRLWSGGTASAESSPEPVVERHTGWFYAGEHRRCVVNAIAVPCSCFDHGFLNDTCRSDMERGGK